MQRHSSFILILGLALASLRCGAMPDAPPTIARSPANQSAAVGATATFEVEASGTPPLTYEWRWNGIVINGATGPSYTTPAIVPADHASTFRVKVTNRLGSATSAEATLSVPGSPRPPQRGDLRFKDLDAFPFTYTPYGVGDQGDTSNLLPNGTVSFNNSVGTPLEVGTTAGVPSIGGSEPSAWWDYAVVKLPPGGPNRVVTYHSGLLENIDAEIDGLYAANAAITSLDINSAAQVYAVQQVAGDLAPASQGFAGYGSVRQVVPRSFLQGAATAAGARGEVMTAVALDGDQAHYVAYSFQDDQSTYEALVVDATVATVPQQAKELAAQGYVITAVGGNDREGFVLVGTRVLGDHTPRLLSTLTIPLGSGSCYKADPGRGYTLLAMVDDFRAGAANATVTCIDEQ